MRIAIATAVYHPMINGVAVFAHNLAVGLKQRGHEVLVLCPSQTGESYAREEDGVRVQYVRAVNTHVYPDQIHAAEAGKKWYRHGMRVAVRPGREVRKALEEFCPEVMHVQVADLIGMAAAGWARKYGVPVVTTEHNQPEVLTESLRLPRALKQLANGALVRYFVRWHGKSDYVTMPTQLAIDKLLGGKELGVPVEAVSNGVDLSAFAPGRARKEVYARYGLEADAQTVLYVGRLDPEKRVGAVIEAFLRAEREMQNVRDLQNTRSMQDARDSQCVQSAQAARDLRMQLVIAGGGVDKARLEGLAKGHESVRFLGRVVPPELYEVYKLGDVFATASEIETQGIVLIEAAATGLPLIAVDAGAVSEVCQDGVNGVLCRPRDVAEMAEAMRRLLTDEKLRKRYAKRSAEIAQEHDLAKTIEEFEEIYRKVSA